VTVGIFQNPLVKKTTPVLDVDFLCLDSECRMKIYVLHAACHQDDEFAVLRTFSSLHRVSLAAAKLMEVERQVHEIREMGGTVCWPDICYEYVNIVECELDSEGEGGFQVGLDRDVLTDPEWLAFSQTVRDRLALAREDCFIKGYCTKEKREKIMATHTIEHWF
jgi:hypothetical protein